MFMVLEVSLVVEDSVVYEKRMSELINNRDLLNLYRAQIMRYPLLTPEQEVEIGRRIRSAEKGLCGILVSTHFGKEAFSSIDKDILKGLRDVHSFVKPVDSSVVDDAVLIGEYGDFQKRVRSASCVDEGNAAWDSFRLCRFSYSELEYVLDSFYSHLPGCDSCSFLGSDVASLRYEHHAAAEEMFNSNLRLVVSVAMKYRRGNLLDRIQDGNSGLMNAVVRFDPERGNKFSTYAYWWIKQAIKRELDTNGHIAHFGAHFYDKIQKVREFRKSNPDKASDQGVVCSAAGVSADDINIIDHCSGLINPLSLDMKLKGSGDDSGDGSTDLYGVLPDSNIPDPETVCSARESDDNFFRILGMIDDADAREILKMHFYDGLGVADMAKEKQWNNERVKQALNKSLRVLKFKLENGGSR